ncbi:MAG: sigma-70 family RNA polymerase sigma factor [Fibrobacteraceae bacterium]|nr:sigma-70 family RNA polymerase sigma factor [Fibrobacteraceae bacterium]
MSKKQVHSTLPNWVESVWKLHSDKIYKLCSMRCGGEDSADDLFQEVALKFCQNAGGVNSPDSILAWLAVVIRNCHYDYMRGKFHMNPVSCLSESERVFYEAAPNEKSVFFHKSREEENMENNVVRALAVLDPFERLLVDLCFCGGASTHEVGRILGISKSAVTKKRRKAVEKMRQKIQMAYSA